MLLAECVSCAFLDVLTHAWLILHVFCILQHLENQVLYINTYLCFFKLFVVVAFCLYFALQTWPEVLSSSVAIFKPCSLSICRTTRFSYRSGVNRSRCKERPAHLDPWRRAQQSYQEYASFLVDFSYLLKTVLRLKF